MQRTHGIRSILALLTVVNGAVASAQHAEKTITFPSIPHDAAGRSTIPLSAAEAAGHVRLEYATIMFGVSPLIAAFPKDSVTTLGATRAERWQQLLEATPVRGMHLDPAGRVSVGTLDEAKAKRQIAERLATPGLS